MILTCSHLIANSPLLNITISKYIWFISLFYIHFLQHILDLHMRTPAFCSLSSNLVSCFNSFCILFNITTHYVTCFNSTNSIFLSAVILILSLVFIVLLIISLVSTVLSLCHLFLQCYSFCYLYLQCYPF